VYQNIKILLLFVLILLSLFYLFLIQNEDFNANHFFLNSKKENTNKFSIQKLKERETATKQTTKNTINPVKKDDDFPIYKNTSTNQPELDIPDIKPINTNTNHLNQLKLKHNKPLDNTINTENIKREMISKEELLKSKLNSEFNSFKENSNNLIQERSKDFLDFKNEVIENNKKIKFE